MKQQGEKVQEILSNAPLSNPNIGPIKPVVQTSVKRLNKTGVKLPGKKYCFILLFLFYLFLVNFQSNSPTIATPTTPTTPIDLKQEPPTHLQEGSSGSSVRPPVVPSVVPSQTRNGPFPPQRPTFPPAMASTGPPIPPSGTQAVVFLYQYLRPLTTNFQDRHLLHQVVMVLHRWYQTSHLLDHISSLVLRINPQIGPVVGMIRQNLVGMSHHPVITVLVRMELFT